MVLDPSGFILVTSGSKKVPGKNLYEPEKLSKGSQVCCYDYVLTNHEPAYTCGF